MPPIPAESAIFYKPKSLGEDVPAAATATATAQPRDVPHEQYHEHAGPSPVSSDDTRVDGPSIKDEKFVDGDLSILLDETAETFAERQMVHFARGLGEKWACPIPGHNICVPTQDGGHYELTDENITSWVAALCRGEATTSQPPPDVLASFFHGDGTNDSDGSRTIKAVSLAPSRQYSSSVHSRATTPPDTASVNTAHSTSQRSAWSPYSSFLPSLAEEPRAAYFGGKPFKWLGEKSIGTLQGAVLTKRANAHMTRLKRWQKRSTPKLDEEEREKVLGMLGDALEMSRQCYPPRINKLAYAIGREVQLWLHSYPDLPHTREVSLLLIQVQACLIPILLTRISRDDPLAGDLAWELIDALTRVPLTLQQSDTSAILIRIVARELAYSKCASQHSWLGVNLLRIVEMTLEMRLLTEQEQVAIWELAVRRKEQGPENVDTNRPWEVALFALCASQNAWFKDAVLGETGLSSLQSTLDGMLSIEIHVEEVNWEDVSLTLRALAFLSEHRWVAAAVEEDIVSSLLGVFRRSIPERWFCIRFWAMDTVRNIVSHRPTLVHTLVKENAAVAFATLTNYGHYGSSVSGSGSGSGMSSGSPHQRGGAGGAGGYGSGGGGGVGSTPASVTRNRLLEDYKREASKRAEELSRYIKNWTSWEPFLAQLEPVAIAGTF